MTKGRFYELPAVSVNFGVFSPKLDPRQTNQVRSFGVFDLGMVIML